MSWPLYAPLSHAKHKVITVQVIMITLQLTVKGKALEQTRSACMTFALGYTMIEGLPIAW